MRFCSIEDCGREYLAKGYCVTHYCRMHNGQDIHTPIRHRSIPKSCEIEDCKHEPRARGWCYIHYQAWQRHGDPLEEAQYNYYSGAEKAKRNRQRRQGAMLWYKMVHGCVDCGISDPRVLDFDHVRGEKEFNLKDAKSKPLVEILTEIEKCDVVCANCHRIRTQERIDSKDFGSTTFTDLNLKKVF